MKRIDSLAQLSPLITAQFQRGVITNAAFTPQLFQQEIAAGALFAREIPGGLLLLRRADGYDRLSFYLQKDADLSAWQPEGTVVLEVASRPRDTALREREGDWEALGFSLRFRRQRMVRTQPVSAPAIPGHPVRFAREGDIPAIFALMHAAYDAPTACLPSAEDLLADICRKQVVVAEQDAAVAAFLRMVPGKGCVECRHLVVAEPLRGRGIAAALFTFFDREAGMSKNLVWVSTGNPSALRLYTKLGFTPDGWTSGVWVYHGKGND